MSDCVICHPEKLRKGPGVINYICGKQHGLNLPAHLEPSSYPQPRLIDPEDPKHWHDERGVFVEPWRCRGEIPQVVCGLTSWSRKDVVRGLHFQRPPRGLIVRCVSGIIRDVTVDLRRGSPEFGRVRMEMLARYDGALWVPPGFAHGFRAMLHDTIVVYDCTGVYNQETSDTLSWKDPKIRPHFGVAEFDAIVSAKDQAGKLLSEIEPIDV